MADVYLAGGPKADGGAAGTPSGPRELKGGMGITAGPLFSMGQDGGAAPSGEAAPAAEEPKPE